MQGWLRQEGNRGKVKGGWIMLGLAGGGRNIYFNLVFDFEKQNAMLPNETTTL